MLSVYKIEIPFSTAKHKHDFLMENVCVLHVCMNAGYRILKIIFYYNRSQTGMALLCCSWDGTVAYLEFTTDEIGTPLTVDEKVGHRI